MQSDDFAEIAGESLEAAEKAAALLGVDAKELIHRLQTRSITVAGIFLAFIFICYAMWIHVFVYGWQIDFVSIVQSSCHKYMYFYMSHQ
jgi:hypothetical protein